LRHSSLSLFFVIAYVANQHLRSPGQRIPVKAKDSQCRRCPNASTQTLERAPPTHGSRHCGCIWRLGQKLGLIECRKRLPHGFLGGVPVSGIAQGSGQLGYGALTVGMISHSGLRGIQLPDLPGRRVVDSMFLARGRYVSILLQYLRPIAASRSAFAFHPFTPLSAMNRA
jgi:hypothetical protein